MRLRNKKTGEKLEKIEAITYIQWAKKIMMVYINSDGERIMKHYDSLEAFNEEWEDAPEEPKQYYYITSCGVITPRGYQLWENESVYDKKRKEIGNYFLSREEAEKAAEKLKAFKRLEDKGFKFENLDVRLTEYPGARCELWLDAVMPDDAYTDEEVDRDLDICFGDEE